MADLIVALQISAVGMGLVFGAILLLWLVMSLLARLTAGRPAAPAAPVVGEGSAEAEIRQRAAAAAVAVALASHPGPLAPGPRAAPAPPAFVAPPAAGVGAWQTVMRGRGLKQPGARR